MQELVMSFSLLEEKVIAQYTVAKVFQSLCLVDFEDFLFGVVPAGVYRFSFLCFLGRLFTLTILSILLFEST